MSARSRTQGRALFVVIRALLGVVVLVGLFYVGWLAATEAQSFGPFSKGVANASTTAATNATNPGNSSTSAAAPSGAGTSPATLANPYAASYETGSEVVIDNNTINVALSTTTAEIDQGLQYQPTLGANDGMLFIFSTAKNYQFWMPNMNFSLDMIWIGSDMKVVAISRDAPPLPDPSNPVWFRPGTPAQYVLEVNADYAAGHNINVGDTVQFVSIPQ